MSDKGSQEEIHVVYAERNAAALAFANAALMLGWTAGYGGGDPDWPVLFVETPHGQVSWHLKADELPTGFPVYGRDWDGHDTAEKNRRLHRWIHLGKRGAQ